MEMEFAPIFFFILVAIGLAVAMLVASAILGPRKLTPVKQMPYESGMDPIGDARQRFDVRYYLVAIVFLLFDVELLFLYPWAVGAYSLKEGIEAAAVSPLPDSGAAVRVAEMAPGIPIAFHGLVFGEIVVFIVVLAAAFAYAWRKGVFEWR